MKILVIGGMHGNEQLGIDVVKLFEKSPVSGIDLLLANQQAITVNTRFTGADLNRSFPGGDGGYESKRAKEILEITKDYDVVLDFHNTYCPENDCGFVGEAADNQLNDVAWFLGFKNVIVADYDCINKYATNCLSVEVSLSSPLNQPELWYQRIYSLSRLSRLEASGSVDRYRFVYRMTLEDRDRLNLDQQNLKAFQPMSRKLAADMGLSSPAFPIFIGDRFTPYNYGGVLNLLD